MNILYSLITDEKKSIFTNSKKLVFHLIIISVFTLLFWILSSITDNIEDQENFSDLHNCIYYNVVTHFTVGYGDIVSKSKLFKYLTIIHLFLTALTVTL